jgi:hypothetical protein
LSLHLRPDTKQLEFGVKLLIKNIIAIQEEMNSIKNPLHPWWEKIPPPSTPEILKNELDDKISGKEILIRMSELDDQ